MPRRRDGRNAAHRTQRTGRESHGATETIAYERRFLPKRVEQGQQDLGHMIADRQAGTCGHVPAPVEQQRPHPLLR